MSLSEERGEMLGQIEITSQSLVSNAFALVEESRKIELRDSLFGFVPCVD